MKKAAVASFLAVSVFAVSPGALSYGGSALAQATPAGQITIADPAEFADYDTAMNKTTAPAAQGPALEAFLAKYPKTVVKASIVQRIMIDYSQSDAAGHEHTKAIGAADAELQLNPNDLQAYVIEVAYRTDAAQALTDPAAKQSGLDAAADFARKGLAASKPAGMSDTDFAALKAYATPTFYGTIAADNTGKKDYAAAITAYKSELSSMKPEALSTPAALQEDFFMGQAYQLSTPPDYVSCTFYTTRAAALAPDQFKPQLQPLATYCYKKYHGNTDGYDAVVTAAKANVDPPADFKITPAPTDADQVNTLMSSTPDAELPKLALSDKEYVIRYGTTAQADKVFDTVKGKSFEIPDGVVVSATADQAQVAVSDDAVQSKTADFTFAMKTPFKTVPPVGTKVTLTGTYTSYTQNPLMFTMTDAEEVTKAAPKKPAAKAPVKRTPHK